MKFLLAIFLMVASLHVSAQFSNMSHFQKYTYDFAVDGGAIGELNLSTKANKAVLPVGAVIKNVVAIVQTPFTSTGAATVAWGDGVDKDGYSGAAKTATTAMVANAVFNGWDFGAELIWDDTNDHSIFPKVINENTGKLTFTIGTVALTAGKADFLVEYLLP